MRSLEQKLFKMKLPKDSGASNMEDIIYSIPTDLPEPNPHGSYWLDLNKGNPAKGLGPAIHESKTIEEGKILSNGKWFACDGHEMIFTKDNSRIRMFNTPEGALRVLQKRARKSGTSL